MRLSILLVAAACLLGQDTDPKQRVKAAKELVKSGVPGIAKLAPYLSDADASVRIEAVRGLVEIGSQYSLEPLLKALADTDPEVQIRATDGLVNFYLPGYVKTGLSGTLSRAGSMVRARFSTDRNDQVIDAWIEVRPEVVDGLGKLLASGAAMDARANAARALGILRGRAALDALHEALRSKDTRLIFESLTALEKIQDRRSGPQVAFLFRDPEERVAELALSTAGLVRSAETLPDIEVAFQRVSSPRVKRAALGAMAAIADPRSIGQFRSMIDSKDESLRAAAAEGLGRLKDKADVAAIEKCFNEERRMPPRLACAFALVTQGQLEGSEFSPLRYLINTLNAKAWRGVAEGYLVELARNKAIRTSMERDLGGANKEEKIQLVRILAAAGDADTVAAVERLTRDSEPEVMQASVRALRSLKARLP